MFFDPKLNLFKSDAYIFMQQSPSHLEPSYKTTTLPSYLISCISPTLCCPIPNKRKPHCNIACCSDSERLKNTRCRNFLSSH
ncbi:hypothetical protein C3Y93_01150 [Acinetobacter sp. SWBY1]|nr:hypothetical protein C3Y93_01150 [Acinetobacter sp. SWBY1]